MEKPSTSTLSHSFSMAEPVGFLFLHTILNWVIITLQKFTPTLHSFKCSSSTTTHDEQCTKIPQIEPTRGDLALSREDVGIVMGRMGMSSKKGEQLDEHVGFDELADLFADSEPCLEEVKEAFCVFDEGKDGFIDALDLQRILPKLGFGEGLALEACEGMIAAYDENRDGRIDLIEFVKLMERCFC